VSDACGANQEAQSAIRDVYAQVRAPGWAAANLDALTDVLRDLSWLPAGPVDVREPAEPRVATVLRRAVEETAGGPHPVRLQRVGPGAS
jgi:hypothetical protein